MLERRWQLSVVLLVLGAGCSKPAGEVVTAAADAVGQMAVLSVVPQDASRQAQKLLDKIADEPRCDEFRERILAAGSGPPASGKTQMALSQTMRDTRDVGCATKE